MAEPLTYSAITTAYGGMTAMDHATDAPYVLIGGGTASYEKEVNDTWTLKATGQVWLGVTNQLDQASLQSTSLRGTIGRLPYFMNRSPLAKNADLNDLVFSAEHKPSGLKLSLAPKSQIEKGYPYLHNQAAQLGGHPINENASMDTNAPADLYNPKIGPAILLSWKLPFLEGAEIYAQMGTGGSAIWDTSKLFKTLTAKYTLGSLESDDSPKMAGHNFQLSLAGYYMALDPDNPVDADGNKLGPSSGFGFSLAAQVKDVVDVSVGYSANSHGVEAKDGNLLSGISGLNLSTAIYVGKRAVLHLGYSELESTERQVERNFEKQVAKESAVTASVMVPFGEEQKIALIAGYQAVFVQQGEGENRNVFGLTLNKTW